METANRASLRCRANSEDFERKLGPRLVVSETILQTNQSDANACGNLSILPGEVLLDVFDTVGHAPSQIAFALTCKRLAALARSVDLARTSTSAKYAGFLPVGVFDIPDLMASLRSWNPTSLRLCGHCLTFRPSSAAYWQGKKGFERNDFWIQKIGWNFKDASWRKQTHDICPSCHWTCTLSDYVDCDGCRALGRLGDVDWARVSHAAHNHSVPTADPTGNH